MSFEIRERDLLAKIGVIETKSGKVETPLLLPVVNPSIQPVSPKIMQREFGVKALMTNAYIIRKRFESKAVEKGIQGLLDFDGVVMTDSGAYQILVYGGVKVTNREIIEFQEKIGSDIAVILDLPTGWGVSEGYARRSVCETLKRAEEWSRVKSRNDLLWVGPVQGGVYLDLISKAARTMSRLPFHLHALGSPTPVMEQYLFDTLVDMIMAARLNLPADRPLHLFGAGHPFMFSLVTALGCDLFDSAAYAIYAREDRYMTENGTVRLDELEYFPCACSECSKADPQGIKDMPPQEKQEFLARHNLHVSLSEIKRIKQAVAEGRLWELLEMRSHAHPALLSALKRLGKYNDHFEANAKVTKKSGLFFYGSDDLARPEVVRHSRRLLERYTPPEEATILLLLPQTRAKPFHKSREYIRVLERIELELGHKASLIRVCAYVAPFGVVPVELDEVYPLSQYEVAFPPDLETINYVATQVRSFIRVSSYANVVLLQEMRDWKGKIGLACKTVCRQKNIPLTVVKSAKPWRKSTLDALIEALGSVLERKP